MREKVRKVAFLTGVRTFLSQKLDLSDQLALRYVKYTSLPAGKTFSFLREGCRKKNAAKVWSFTEGLRG